MKPDPCRLPSGNLYVPYEYQRRGLTKVEADNYRCLNIYYARFFNGELTDTVTDRFFFNRMHFEGCLKRWNDLGDSMARTPSPVDGKIYHWSYREISI